MPQQTSSYCHKQSHLLLCEYFMVILIIEDNREADTKGFRFNSMAHIHKYRYQHQTRCSDILTEEDTVIKVPHTIHMAFLCFIWIAPGLHTINVSVSW